MNRVRVPLRLIGLGIAAVFVGFILFLFDVATGRMWFPAPDDPPNQNGDPITTNVAFILGLLGTGVVAVGVLGLCWLWLLQRIRGRGL